MGATGVFCPAPPSNTARWVRKAVHRSALVGFFSGLVGQFLCHFLSKTIGSDGLSRAVLVCRPRIVPKAISRACEVSSLLQLLASFLVLFYTLDGGNSRVLMPMHSG